MQEFGRHILLDIQPEHALDIGCGTGSWVIEVADDYPKSLVKGVDISPVQPESVPPNCDFYLDNVLQGLTFPDKTFDFVQSRAMGASIPDNCWPQYVAEIWRMMKPGGWVQFIEIEPFRHFDDQIMPPRSPLGVYEKIVEKVMTKVCGVTLRGLGSRLPQFLEDAGFVNILPRCGATPLGTWTSGKCLRLFHS